MDLLKFLLRPLFAKEIQEEQNKRYLQLERNGILKNQLIEAENEINRLNCKSSAKSGHLRPKI